MAAALSIEPWSELNRQLMIAGIDLVRDRLERHAHQNRKPVPGGERAGPPVPAGDRLERMATDIEKAIGAPPALAAVCQAFKLSRFERDVLLLCAASEMEGSIPALCAAASEGRRPFPTFSLALAALEGGHWSATPPLAPLRYHRLVDLDPTDGLAFGRLRIDERILHHLAGVSRLDQRLASLLEALPTEQDLHLAEAHRAAADRLAGMWRRWKGALADNWLPVHLCGVDAAEREAVVSRACSQAELALFVLRGADVPLGAIERDALIRLWEREVALAPAVLLIDVDDGESAELQRALGSLVERLRGIVVVSGRDPVRLRRRPGLRVDLGAPTTLEQEALWRSHLGPLADQLDGAVPHLASHFRLGPSGMRSVVSDVTERLAQTPAEANGSGSMTVEQVLADATWKACRRQARPRLDDLAQRIETHAGWEELVLPADQMQMLRGIAAHVRQRAVVYERWGFSGKGSRGLGITALFSGASGTGKTLAAEVLAAELDLDLYRIDLSQVVNKYIGETEKNLRRIFDAAEEGGAILLFDEADALFGKRSEVKDSHDRYANLEVSYLLQRMEAYRGLAVLTTNMRAALDTAFLRRLRFIVEFPFPGIEERTAIWRRVFPADVPLGGVEPQRLASLNVTGGVIRNIALSAAFLAADDGERVTMVHLRRAAGFELAKLERPATEAELGGWK